MKDLRTHQRAKAAAMEILEQVVEEVEKARQVRGMSVADLAERAHLSKRTVGLIRSLKVEPAMSSLIALVESVGLRLAISARLDQIGRAHV